MKHRHTHRYLLISFLTASCGLFVWGCGKKAGSPPEKRASEPQSESARPPGGPSARRATPKDIRARLTRGVERAASCDLSEPGPPYKCEKYREVRGLVRRSYRKEPTVVLDVLTELLGGDDHDEKSAEVASFLLGTSYADSAFLIADRKGIDVPAEVSGRLLRAVKRARGARAVRLARPAAFAATMTGHAPRLIKASRAHPTKEVAPNVVENLMVYGGMKMFDPIRRIAKQGPPALVRAALAAPYKLSKWPESARTKICKLGRAHLEDDNLEVAARAAMLLARCGGKHVEPLLAEGKKRARAGKWKEPFSSPFGKICLPMRGARPERVTEEQCEKVFGFLEWVANQSSVQPRCRALALRMIHNQRRNEKTYDLLAKYKNHPVEEIRKTAKKEMAILKKRVLRWKKMNAERKRK